MMGNPNAQAAQALARVPLFAEFSSDELQALVSHTRGRQYKQEEVVFEQGDPGVTFYLIQSGLIKVYLSSVGGREVVLAILHAGEFFGELSLIDGLPRSASASALQPTETLEIGRDDFRTMLGEHHAAMYKVCAVLARRLRRSDGIIADAAFLDLRGRLAKRLLDLAEEFGRPVGDTIELTVQLRQQALADMVGVTRESVNRVLSTMEAEGLVTFLRGKVTIRRVDDLARICEENA